MDIDEQHRLIKKLQSLKTGEDIEALSAEDVSNILEIAVSVLGAGEVKRLIMEQIDKILMTCDVEKLSPEFLRMVCEHFPTAGKG